MSLTALTIVLYWVVALPQDLMNLLVTPVVAVVAVIFYHLAFKIFRVTKRTIQVLVILTVVGIIMLAVTTWPTTLEARRRQQALEEATAAKRLQAGQAVTVADCEKFLNDGISIWQVCISKTVISDTDEAICETQAQRFRDSYTTGCTYAKDQNSR